MKIILITLKKILFWSYERGSWQYDLMCVLILAFIFFTHNSVFQSQNTSTPLTVRGDEIGKFEPNGIRPIEDPPRQKDSNAASISRIEKSEASSGTNNYVAWRKTSVRSVQFTEKQYETK